MRCHLRSIYLLFTAIIVSPDSSSSSFISKDLNAYSSWEFLGRYCGSGNVASEIVKVGLSVKYFRSLSLLLTWGDVWEGNPSVCRLDHCKANDLSWNKLIATQTTCLEKKGITKATGTIIDLPLPSPSLSSSFVNVSCPKGASGTLRIPKFKNRSFSVWDVWVPRCRDNIVAYNITLSIVGDLKKWLLLSVANCGQYTDYPILGSALVEYERYGNGNLADRSVSHINFPRATVALGISGAFIVLSVSLTWSKWNTNTLLCTIPTLTLANIYLIGVLHIVDTIVVTNRGTRVVNQVSRGFTFLLCMLTATGWTRYRKRIIPFHRMCICVSVIFLLFSSIVYTIMEEEPTRGFQSSHFHYEYQSTSGVFFLCSRAVACIVLVSLSWSANSESRPYNRFGVSYICVPAALWLLAAPFWLIFVATSQSELSCQSTGILDIVEKISDQLMISFLAWVWRPTQSFLTNIKRVNVENYINRTESDRINVFKSTKIILNTFMSLTKSVFSDVEDLIESLVHTPWSNRQIANNAFADKMQGKTKRVYG